MNNRDDADFLKAVSEKNFEDIERLFPFASTDAHRLYISADEFTPLHRANSAFMVQYCISSGIDVDFRNAETDETPLLTSIKLNKPTNVIRELLKQGADVEARNKHTLNTPLNQALHIVDCRPENVQALLENDADPNTVNKYGVMPLHMACQNFEGDLRIVELLLKRGALINREDSKGQTPLSIALQNFCCTDKLLHLLLKFNANVSLENIRNAIDFYELYEINMMEQLLQRASVTTADGWKDILQLAILIPAKSEEITKCGKLVIKYAFLQCADPYKTLRDFLLAEKENVDRSLNQIERQNTLRRDWIHYVPQYDGMMYCGVAKIDDLLLFVDNCSSEVERMRADMIKNTSVYKIIMSKTLKLFTDNKILEMLEENRYPIYRDVILSKIKRPSLLEKLMSQEVYTVVQSGDIARRVALDHSSVSCIAVYLDENEIKNFVDAFCNPSKREYYFWDKLVKIEAGLSERKLQICGGNTSETFQCSRGNRSEALQHNRGNTSEAFQHRECSSIAQRLRIPLNVIFECIKIATSKLVFI